jgi:hypothetical protein
MSTSILPTDWEVIASTANGESQVIFDIEGRARVSVPGDQSADLDDSQVEEILKNKYGVEITSLISWEQGEADGESVGFFGYEVSA